MSNLEQELLNEVSLDGPWELVETFAKFPRWEPAKVNQAADMIADRLKASGVPVTLLEPELYLSIPYSAEVGADGETFKAKPPGFSREVRDGLEAELVHVPAVYSKGIGNLFDKNQDEDASRAERIAGKIVISEGFSFPGKILEFEQKGAVGVIAVNPGANAHWGICTSIWGTPDLDDLPRKPNLPVAAVNNPDGKKLIALSERGGRARIRTRMEEKWFPSKLPLVEIRGTEEPEKFILLHGHYDSWDVGVGDNATGNAAMMEIARVLWNNRDKLKRSVRIAWWPGHSTGRYAGSTWFADAFAIDLDENCVAQINCDSPGCRWASVFKDISWMAETESFVQKVIKDVTGLDSHGERPHHAGDYSFNNIGISSFFMLSSTMPDELRKEKGYYTVGGCGGNIAWHTEEDTLEIADRDNLLRDIKVYLAAILRVANADVLPFDWRSATGDFQRTLDRYEKAADGRFDLKPSRQAVEELAGSLDRFYAEVDAGRVSKGAANEVIRELARILVPINFTQVPRFRPDPALPIPALPTLSAVNEFDGYGGDAEGFVRTQLTRGQNRLVAALRQARRLVEGTLSA